MAVAMVIGAVGNVVGSAHRRRRHHLGHSASTDLLYITLANVLGLLTGFTLGVLIRNSAGAIVGYFVYALLLPTITGLLAAEPGVVPRRCSPGSNFQWNQQSLFEGGFTGAAVGPARRHRRPSGWSCRWPSGSGGCSAPRSSSARAIRSPGRPGRETCRMRIQDVARHATSLTGVRQKECDGLLGWYVGDRLVARQQDAETLVVRSDFEDRERLVEEHPTTFSVTPRIEGHQKVLADTRRGDLGAVRVALTAAWELQRR